jgi:hypothetical protein
MLRQVAGLSLRAQTRKAAPERPSSFIRSQAAARGQHHRPLHTRRAATMPGGGSSRSGAEDGAPDAAPSNSEAPATAGATPQAATAATVQAAAGAGERAVAAADAVQAEDATGGSDYASPEVRPRRRSGSAASACPPIPPPPTLCPLPWRPPRAASWRAPRRRAWRRYLQTLPASWSWARSTRARWRCEREGAGGKGRGPAAPRRGPGRPLQVTAVVEPAVAGCRG